MMKRKLLLASVATAIGLGASPAFAAVDLYLDVAPPPPRHEVIPAARPGYIWAPGYWDWHEGRHVWKRGHWVRERKGYYWHPSRWEERNGRWHFEQGRWDRERYAENRRAWGDRDHDGIPNKYDHDRDNDGVPNRADNAPDNPYRR